MDLTYLYYYVCSPVPVESEHNKDTQHIPLIPFFMSNDKPASTDKYEMR